MFNLSEKKALVTGASRGIGKGIALALAKAGASVVINYHSKSEEAEKVVLEIKNLGLDSFLVQADVSKKQEVIKMFDVIKSRFGQLNILVNNAGIARINLLEQISEEEWDAVVDTNLKSQFLCIQEAIKLMPIGSKIINLSSIASGGVGVGFGRIAHYAASKGGVIALTEDLAIELGSKGINVNTIAPGVIETDMTSSLLSDEQTKKGLLMRIPKGRFGKPEDIGATAVFLSSDEADYITGSVIYVDGGWLTE